MALAWRLSAGAHRMMTSGGREPPSKHRTEQWSRRNWKGIIVRISQSCCELGHEKKKKNNLCRLGAPPPSKRWLLRYCSLRWSIIILSSARRWKEARPMWIGRSGPEEAPPSSSAFMCCWIFLPTSIPQGCICLSCNTDSTASEGWGEQDRADVCVMSKRPLWNVYIQGAVYLWHGAPNVAWMERLAA